MKDLLFFLNYVFLLTVIVAGVFNWIYAKETLKAKQEFGITLPSFVEKLLKTNVFISFFAAIFIIFLIIVQAI